MALHDTSSERVFALFLQSGPAAALGALPLAALPGVTGAHEEWVRGAALGALGRYGEARTVLEALLDDPAAHGSLAASTLASHLRQLGRHREARALDERALATAEQVEPAAAELTGPAQRAAAALRAGALFDARLGLAADAVGVADVTEARRWLAQAGDGGGLWRREVRLGWVRTEIALLDADPLNACAVAATALSTARTAAAPRHEAKCLLFLGAALDAADDARATGLLAEAARSAASLGATPLLWVAELLLARRAQRRGDTPGWSVHLAASRAAVTAIGDALPANDRTAWLNRPDIAAIVHTGPDRGC
jgi:tetratricopeptide (TPR) repeat protein